MAKEFEGAISGDAVEEMVKTAAGVHNSEHKTEILDGIKDAVTMCKKQGKVLQELFEEDTLSVHIPAPNSTLQDHNWVKIERNLMGGMAALMFVKLPESKVHVFAIVRDEDKKPYVLHGWQGHSVRLESSMAIEDLVSLLKDLHSYDYTKASDVSVACDKRKQIWGSDHMGSSEPVECQEPVRITFEAVLTGFLQVPLGQCEEKLGSMSVELAEWCNVASQTTEDPDGFRAAFGFVFGSGGALELDDGDLEIQQVTPTDQEKLLARGQAQLAGGAVAKLATPGIARIGVSVVRANAAAGAVLFGINALWDVQKWAQNDITAVQLRKNFAQNAAGAAGGVAAGIAAGAAGGFLGGPLGAFVGGVLGGIAGGLAGGAAGKALDEAIWDENEDLVMESYDFFGWRFVSRCSRPKKSGEEVREAYLHKLRGTNQPSGVKDNDWAKYCTAMLMVLLRAMYPELKQMFEIAEDLNESKTKAVTMIGTCMYSSLEEEENH